MNTNSIKKLGEEEEIQQVHTVPKFEQDPKAQHRQKTKLFLILFPALYLMCFIAYLDLDLIRAARSNSLKNAYLLSCLSNKFTQINRNKNLDIQLSKYIEYFEMGSSIDPNLKNMSCEGPFRKLFLEYLYENDAKMLTQRQDFHRDRINFIKKYQNYEQIYLAKHNLDSNLTDLQERNSDLSKNFQRLSEKYNFTNYDTELSFCIVVAGYNNDEHFRVESNLNSLLNQNYSNFKLVIIDDNSSDTTGKRVQRYLNFYSLRPPFVRFIQNKERKRALKNLYEAFHSHCGEEDIGLTFDADDEMLGRNVLKVFNAIYQRSQPGFAYSRFYLFNQYKEILQYSLNQKMSQTKLTNNDYRDGLYDVSQIRTFLVRLFRRIELADLQDKQKMFYKVDYDYAITIPMLEMSCGHIQFVPEMQMVYNFKTGINDFEIDQPMQIAIVKEIDNKQKYPCSEEFANRLPKKNI